MDMNKLNTKYNTVEMLQESVSWRSRAQEVPVNVKRNLER